MATKQIPDLSLLITLDSRIWSIGNEGQQPSNRSIGQYHIEKDGAGVSKEEWKKIKQLVEIHSLICVPGSGTFGFGRSIAFYKQPDPAPYPGTEKVFKPEYMLCLTNHHMEKVLKSDTPKNDYKLWWEEMEPLVYNPKNEALIKQHMPKRQQLQDPSYYEY